MTRGLLAGKIHFLQQYQALYEIDLLILTNFFDFTTKKSNALDFS